MATRSAPDPDLILGIDIGGSGMKAAPVSISHGEWVTDRHRIPTPRPAVPDAMARVVADLIAFFEWSGPVGCTFPGVIRRSAVVGSAANLDESWIDVDAAALFSNADCPVTMINDADAAGLAEMRHGAGLGVDGVVMIVTIGTGFGTAIFHDGKLLPNTELGHISVNGIHAEEYATSRAKKAQDLSTTVWAARLQEYLDRLEQLMSPDLFILGGGISKEFDEFGPLLDTRADIVPAALRNHAGIVGAAMAAADATC